MRIVGVDIGGTGIKSALIECGAPDDAASYRIIERASVHTDGKQGRDKVIDNICVAIDKFIAQSDASIIGVGSAGDIDDTCGVITFATDALPGFTGLELRELLAERFGKRVNLVNDAVAALVGEAYVGNSLKGRPMMLTLGTGLGCAMIEDISKPLGSGSIENIRLGHIELHDGGRQCKCGLKGCAEQYVSATGLKLNAGMDRVEEILSSDKSRAAVREFLADFKSVLEVACDRYSPTNIIIGGGVVEMSQYWWDDLVSICDKNIACKLVKAKLGNRAALLGSVFAALNGRYGIQNGIY
ncbi:MAG: ROK family protein [Clostridia bacterium]|nr:ROK family protein [Clostridia bacterium]